MKPATTFAYHIAPRGHLIIAVAALEMARDAPPISAATRRKITVALASARRDLAGFEGKSKRKRRKRTV